MNVVKDAAAVQPIELQWMQPEGQQYSAVLTAVVNGLSDAGSLVRDHDAGLRLRLRLRLLLTNPPEQQLSPERAKLFAMFASIRLQQRFGSALSPKSASRSSYQDNSRMMLKATDMELRQTWEALGSSTSCRRHFSTYNQTREEHARELSRIILDNMNVRKGAYSVSVRVKGSTVQVENSLVSAYLDLSEYPDSLLDLVKTVFAFGHMFALQHRQPVDFLFLLSDIKKACRVLPPASSSSPPPEVSQKTRLDLSSLQQDVWSRPFSPNLLRGLVLQPNLIKDSLVNQYAGPTADEARKGFAFLLKSYEDVGTVPGSDVLRPIFMPVRQALRLPPPPSPMTRSPRVPTQRFQRVEAEADPVAVEINAGNTATRHVTPPGLTIRRVSPPDVKAESMSKCVCMCIFDAATSGDALEVLVGGGHGSGLYLSRYLPKPFKTFDTYMFMMRTAVFAYLDMLPEDWAVRVYVDGSITHRHREDPLRADILAKLFAGSKRLVVYEVTHAALQSFEFSNQYSKTSRLQRKGAPGIAFGALLRYFAWYDPVVEIAMNVDVDNIPMPVFIETILSWAAQPNKALLAFVDPGYRRRGMPNACRTSVLAGMFGYKKQAGTVAHPWLVDSIVKYLFAQYDYEQEHQNIIVNCDTSEVDPAAAMKHPFSFGGDENALNNVFIRNLVINGLIESDDKVMVIPQIWDFADGADVKANLLDYLNNAFLSAVEKNVTIQLQNPSEEKPREVPLDLSWIQHVEAVFDKYDQNAPAAVRFKNNFHAIPIVFGALYHLCNRGQLHRATENKSAVQNFLQRGARYYAQYPSEYMAVTGAEVFQRLQSLLRALGASSSS